MYYLFLVQNIIMFNFKKKSVTNFTRKKKKRKLHFFLQGICSELDFHMYCLFLVQNIIIIHTTHALSPKG
jgi:hypothetical protein